MFPFIDVLIVVTVVTSIFNVSTFLFIFFSSILALFKFFVDILSNNSRIEIWYTY